MSSVNDLQMALNDTLICSAHFDGQIRFFDMHGEKQKELPAFKGQVTSLQLSDDGTALLASSRDNVIKLIDLRTYATLAEFSEPGRFRTGVNYSRASMSADGCYVAAGSTDGYMYIWNALSTKLEARLKCGKSSVNAVAWSPILSKRLLAGDAGKNLHVWD